MVGLNAHVTDKRLVILAIAYGMCWCLRKYLVLISTRVAGSTITYVIRLDYRTYSIDILAQILDMFHFHFQKCGIVHATILHALMQFAWVLHL
jgi:hypothetical protein